MAGAKQGGKGQEPTAKTGELDPAVETGTPPEGTATLNDDAPRPDADVPAEPDSTQLGVSGQTPGVLSLPVAVEVDTSECVWPSVELRFQQRTDDVRVLQEAMLAAGVYSGRLDGWYGMQTVAAVARMQRAALSVGIRPVSIDGQWTQATRAAVCRYTSAGYVFD